MTMKIGIIAAMEEEMRAIKAELTEIVSEKISVFEFFKGNFTGHEVVLVQSGIGKVNSAIAATLLYDHFDVEAVINTGSAGALQTDLDIGDIVIGQELYYGDVDATAFGYQVGQVPQMPFAYKTDEKLQDVFAEAAEGAGFRVVFGDILTNDSFVADPEKVAYFQNEFPQAQVCEMEGAAIGQVAYQFDRPYLVVRAVSDRADGKASQTFDEFIIEAGEKSAQMLLKALKKL